MKLGRRLKKKMQIEGIIFDFGGTIDTGGIHWFHKFLQIYDKFDLKIDEIKFRDVYIYGERNLDRNSITKDTSFYDVWKMKIAGQLDYIGKEGITDIKSSDKMIKALADNCYEEVQSSIENKKELISKLSGKYQTAMVSNFYGNIEKVLGEFGMDSLLRTVMDSAVSGIRKPEPQRVREALKEMGLSPESTVVTGDSYDKDIAPAKSIGCNTIWLDVKGWKKPEDDYMADTIINDFNSLIDEIDKMNKYEFLR